MKLSTAFIIIGVILAIFGVLALANPFAASLAVTTLVGIVFLVGGIAQAWALFQAGAHEGRIWNGLVALLTIIGGVWLLADPLAGTLSLTLLLGIIFLVLGVIRLAMSASMRDTPFFWLMLLSGIASVAIGLMVLFDLGSAATAFLGLLLGIQLVADGAGLFAYALILRRRGF